LVYEDLVALGPQAVYSQLPYLMDDYAGVNSSTVSGILEQVIENEGWSDTFQKYQDEEPEDDYMEGRYGKKAQFDENGKILEEALQVAEQHGGRPEEAVAAAGEYLDQKGIMTFGVESVAPFGYGSYDPILDYANTGETYDATICYDNQEGFFIGSWGDWLEGVEQERAEEGDDEGLVEGEDW